MTMGTFTLFDTTTLWEADGTDLIKATQNFFLLLDQSADALTPSSVSLYSGLAHEVPNGNGYTTGGVALTGVSLTRASGTTTFSWTGPSPTWIASGTGIPPWRWVVLYVNATINGHVSPLIGFCLGDGTNIDIPTTQSPNTITVTASGGAFTITHSP